MAAALKPTEPVQGELCLIKQKHHNSSIMRAHSRERGIPESQSHQVNYISTPLPSE